MVARTHALVLAFFLMQTPLPADAQTTPEPIRHTLSFPAPQTNYFDVSAVVPTMVVPRSN